MKAKKILLIIFIVLLIPIVLILTFRLFINAVYFVSVNYFPHPEWDDWKTETSPLTGEQKDILCEKFDLTESSICIKEDVYGPDFYPYIIDTFHPSEEFRKFGIGPEPFTYEEVDEKLGIFKIDCGPNIQGPTNETQLYLCSYDLRGDGKNHLGIYFVFPENTVFRITRPVGKDEY
jgi:hypothetical protein